MQFSELSKDQEKRHMEMKDWMDTVRTEAHRRESKILESIEAVSRQNREESRELRTELTRVHSRVDSILERNNQRRRTDVA